MKEVVLVDADDKVIGVAEKLAAHEAGQLHRAVSVWLFNDQRETLLQKRALEKYHSGGKWSNTCCTHPEPGQQTDEAAVERLAFEMGINAKLHLSFSFIYRVELDNGLIEHELDHVFFGHWNGDPKPNPAEVMDWKWIALSELRHDVASLPNDFTYWLKVMCAKLFDSGNSFNFEER